MKRFRKVLVPVDVQAPKHEALERAVRLAEEYGAQLKLVDVVEELPVFLSLPAYGYPALSDTLVGERRRKLESLADDLKSRGVSVETEILYGKRFLEIIREVLRNGHDLVVRTAEPGDGSHVFGTTDMRLLRKCPVPVWLARPNRARKYRRILAAVDPIAEDAGAERLNVQILELAASLAEHEGGELHVLHAWDPVFTGLLEANKGELAKKIAEAVRDRSRADLDALLDHAAVKLPKNQVHLVRGEASQVIRAFDEKNPVDILVMGTVVRTGIEGFIVGNTAEQILGQVKCSVLAIKPDGFVSPVKLPEDESSKQAVA